MLYDPKWKAPVKEKPSLRGFAAWLGTKDPRGRYDFSNCRGECLIGQYMAFLGIPWGDAPKSIMGGGWREVAYTKVAESMFGPRRWHEVADRPWTYGAALKRVQETLGER
jgi:hypothetical protein